MLQIYALSSVKFPHLKLRLCKKNDKYEVCEDDNSKVGFYTFPKFQPTLRNERSFYDFKEEKKEFSFSISFDKWAYSAEHV